MSATAAQHKPNDRRPQLRLVTDEVAAMVAKRRAEAAYALLAAVAEYADAHRAIGCDADRIALALHEGWDKADNLIDRARH